MEWTAVFPCPSTPTGWGLDLHLHLLLPIGSGFSRSMGATFRWKLGHQKREPVFFAEVDHLNRCAVHNLRIVSYNIHFIYRYYKNKCIYIYIFYIIGSIGWTFTFLEVFVLMFGLPKIILLWEALELVVGELRKGGPIQFRPCQALIDLVGTVINYSE